MRIGILIGACGLAVAAATQADVATTAPVTNNVEDRSIDAMHRAIGAPGSHQRDSIVRDLRDRVESGEVSPLYVLIDDALPERLRPGMNNQDGYNNPMGSGGSISFNTTSRGTVLATFDDDFESYPVVDDPIFNRLGINLGGQVPADPNGEGWDFAQFWHIPSFFVTDNPDLLNEPGVADPLPRWEGAILVEADTLGTALIADINTLPMGPPDGVVNTADLGALLGDFGSLTAESLARSDINQDKFNADPAGDGVVDTADLGVLLAAFGQTAGSTFCIYDVTAVNAGDPAGFPLDPVTIAAGPVVLQQIAIENSTYNNDSDVADGCPDCEFFNILTDGTFNGELVYGDWTLNDSGATDLSGVDFLATVSDDTCDGFGSNKVFAEARGETTIFQGGTFNLGAREQFVLMTPTSTIDLKMEYDVFLSTLDTLTWIDTTSRVEGFTLTRMFMGGFATAIDPDWLKYSTNGDGFVNHFLVLGNLQGNFQFGQVFGTAPDPALPVMAGVPNVGKEILPGEWFTLSYRLTQGDVSIWLNDSETRADFPGAGPGDEGKSTPLDGSDDIDGDFVKIFPFGPYGISPGTSPGQVPQIPQPPLAAVSADQFRWVYGGDPQPEQLLGWAPNNIFFDNIHVEGVLFPVPELPKFALNYLDNIETYFADTGLRTQGGRWFDATSSNAVIDDNSAVSGSQSIRQSNSNFDGSFRLEFQTDLPLASANGDGVTPGTLLWTASVNVAMSNNTVARTIRLGDDTFELDDATPTVARLFTGVENDLGNVVIDGSFFSQLHMRVKNPNFNPAGEPVGRKLSLEPAIPNENNEFINVPTDAFWQDQNVYHNFSFEVQADQTLIVRRDGVVINPDPVGALAAGYFEPGMPGVLANGGGWVASSVAVDEMSFESANNILAPNVTMNIDDVSLDGFEPLIADGPAFEIPFAEGFEDYPANAPIDGQGDTPFANGATLVDTNLCIEQGLQALVIATVDPLATYCVYDIKMDSIGGIDPAQTDWVGLADGGSIYVLQADCDGAVACKELYCFENPNRPDEFFPNVGLFDEPVAGTRVAIGARVEANGTILGSAIVSVGDDVFTWDTYDPANIYGRYQVNSFNDVDGVTPGVQAINDPLPVSGDASRNVPYYNGVAGKITDTSIIAVDQVFGVDAMTGFASMPGVLDTETNFKIVDPCELEILTGTWTYLGDGMGNDTALPLVCTDVPHFNMVFEGFPMYNGGLGGEINVIADPTGSGRGNVLKAINNAGNTDDGSLFISLRSTYPDAFAIIGTDCVYEQDIWVQDNKSEYTIQYNGNNGTITEIVFGGPDVDFVLSATAGSPGGVASPAENFRLLEINPDAGDGGPFGTPSPQTWYYDTGEAVPLGAWFRLQITVAADGTYNIAMDESGMIGGDGVFETSIDTDSGNENEGPSSTSGEPFSTGIATFGINSFDTNTGLNEGGDGTFLRDPIEVHHDVTLPGGFSFATDFCFMRIDLVVGEVLGTLPSGCDGTFPLGGIIGMFRDVGIANWPEGGNFDVCPESDNFIWNNDAMDDTCTGDWTYLDPDNDAVSGDLPLNAGEVDAWAEYLVIPPFAAPGAPSTFLFDNITLNGSDVE